MIVDPTLSDPLSRFDVVSPSDSTVLSKDQRCLYVGGDGDLIVIMRGDDTDTPVTFANVVGGTIIPLRVKKVMVLTTATLILAGF